MPTSSADRSRTRFAYVGTYTAPTVAPGAREPSTAEGISVFRLHSETGALRLVQVMPVSNPSFLALGLERAHLYCVNEDEAGQLSAFAIDRTSGELSELNSVSSEGSTPTHLSVHPSGRYVFAANYGSGNYCTVRVEADGSLGRLTGLFQGEGSGPHSKRQEGPHAHQILADPTGAHVFAVDLGADKVHVLQLDRERGTLVAHATPYARIEPGSGPRHLAFHPNKPRAFLLNELASSITVFDHDAARGTLRWLQTISTLPARLARENVAGEIRVHPDGRLLYATNRGHNSIARFGIDPATGTLESLGWQTTFGEWPRGLNIDPTGDFLYVANQNTSTVVVFQIERRSGELRQSAMIATPTPVDLVFG